MWSLGEKIMTFQKQKLQFMFRKIKENSLNLWTKFPNTEHRIILACCCRNIFRPWALSVDALQQIVEHLSHFSEFSPALIHW